MTFISKCEKDTEEFGSELAKSMENEEFIALFGDMGAGKTTFMRGFVRQLVPDARVSSPTYALVNVYTNGDITVNHFDMYRITSEDDLYSTGFYDLLEGAITVCEWSENIPFALPEHYFKITFEKISPDERRITMERI